MKCDHCGRQSDKLPYTCKWCGDSFCVTHRLPESHDCIGLKVTKAEQYLKREYGEDGEVQPWFRGTDTDESQKVSDRYRESHANEACSHCAKSLFEYEGSACRYCGEIYCLDHIEKHTRNCKEIDLTSHKRKTSRTQGSKNHSVDSRSKQGAAPFDELTEKRRKGEKIKKAAHRAEEKRYPDLEPSPDLAPDGSLVHPGDESSIGSEQVDDGDSRYTPRLGKVGYVAIGIAIFLMLLLLYGIYI